MRFAVVGAGAIGGYFGGRLAQAGNDVTFIARGATLQALQEQGLRLESPKGDLHLAQVKATDKADQVGAVDAVLLAVKAWQVPEVVSSLKPLLGAETFVLPLQNGVDAPDQLAAVLGKNYALGGLCWIISSVVARARIRHIGIEPHVVFGELDNRPSKRVQALLAALKHADIKAEISENIQTSMWEKFVFICTVSGVGAITRAPIGQIRELPETRSMLETSMREIVAVAKGLGVTLPPNIIEDRMAFVDRLPEEGTASMQRDIMEGRPSELQSQNGAVVRLGKQVGVKTPLNEFIYHSLLLSEMKARQDT